LRLGKVEEGLRGEDLKEAGKLRQAPVEDQLLGGIVDAEVERGKGVVGDLDAVEADALIDAGQVGRSVEAGAQAEAVRMEASVAAVEPLPLVPAMSTEGKRRCGSPSAASRMRISSSENLRRGWPELW
jgi:hypothetical protein